MSEILLTIGIPTFNGEKFIRQTISSALSQILMLELKNVEILISDNASTDNTEDTVKNLAEDYPNVIKYYRNESNVGFDKNVDFLFKKASGEYVHILGDDDFICEGALGNLLNILTHNQVSVLMLNMSFLNISTEKQYGDFPIEHDILFKNGDEFFQYSKWRTSAVSSIIIKKSEWNSLDLTPYFGNQWIHINAIIEILSKGQYSYIVSKKNSNCKNRECPMEYSFWEST